MSTVALERATASSTLSTFRSAGALPSRPWARASPAGSSERACATRPGVISRSLAASSTAARRGCLRKAARAADGMRVTSSSSRARPGRRRRRRRWGRRRGAQPREQVVDAVRPLEVRRLEEELLGPRQVPHRLLELARAQGQLAGDQLALGLHRARGPGHLVDPLRGQRPAGQPRLAARQVEAGLGERALGGVARALQGLEGGARLGHVGERLREVALRLAELPQHQARAGDQVGVAHLGRGGAGVLATARASGRSRPGRAAGGRG
jgi:hypothetical protein